MRTTPRPRRHLRCRRSGQRAHRAAADRWSNEPPRSRHTPRGRPVVSGVCKTVLKDAASRRRDAGALAGGHARGQREDAAAHDRLEERHRRRLGVVEVGNARAPRVVAGLRRRGIDAFRPRGGQTVLLIVPCDTLPPPRVVTAAGRCNVIAVCGLGAGSAFVSDDSEAATSRTARIVVWLYSCALTMQQQLQLRVLWHV